MIHPLLRVIFQFFFIDRGGCVVLNTYITILQCLPLCGSITVYNKMAISEYMFKFRECFAFLDAAVQICESPTK